MLIALVGLAAGADLYGLLRLRDAVPCSELGEGVRDELIVLAEGGVGPPYVPVRAAGCLVELYAVDPVVVDRAREWVSGGKFLGLGLLVAGRIDAFSVEDAVSIARAAGGDPRMTRRMAKSARVEVRAVVLDGAGRER